jgi:hypothetical protein
METDTLVEILVSFALLVYMQLHWKHAHILSV